MMATRRHVLGAIGAREAAVMVAAVVAMMGVSHMRVILGVKNDIDRISI